MGEDETCVRVAVRIRPQTPREVIEMCRICTSVTPGEPQITLSSDRSFTYDYVFDMGSDQEEIYDTCVKKLVDGALEGYNATVLAYGQTGSGKTYTMGTGFEVEIQEYQIGILPRAIGHLFSGMKERIQNARQNGEPSPEFKVDVQFMELYNDDIIDLLDPTQGYLTRCKGIKIHEDNSGGIYVKGVTQQNVSSIAEALNLLRQGALSRTTGATQMNSQSSRSHAIFTMLVKQQKLVKVEDDDPENVGKSEFATLTAKFHFVDLAGSERLKRTQATGDRAKEGIFINGGLLALGNVISALGDKSKKALHVPYRDSKLTRLLQDSLGGNSQTVMIACVSPSDSDFMETLNTLNYANRARNIKNKVVINQDKSSRTIALLRQQIQELQLQLVEYKQGKRLVGEDGVEIMNDMCHENMLLQTEANNLRTRLKAMQETIDALTKKNSQLLAEKASSIWVTGSGDGSSDVADMVAQYLREIEELQAKLLESEALCQQLRKNTSRQQQAIVLSPTNHNFSFTSNLIAEAKMELSKDLELLTRREKKEKNGNEEISERNGEGSDQSDAEDRSNNSDVDSSSDSTDGDDRESQYGLELVELTTEISMKQKLIEELERSQQKLHSMKQHYEEKLMQLQQKIRATQDERDKVLASVVGQQNPPDKVNKIRQEYERKVNDMQREVKRLETAQKQHAKLLREQNQQNSQLRSLKAEVEEMKRTKVSLMKRMKEETQKHKQLEMQRTREIAMLRKESRRHENQIRSLQAENRVKEAVLRRRNEEVTALRTRTKGIMSRRAAGRVNKLNRKEFSPKAAKSKWTAIEKTINKLKINKKATALIEKDMERLINEREVVGNQLEELIQKRDSLKASPVYNPNDIRDLEEQIEAGQANMNYIQETISECQHNIIEMEDAKNETDLFELQSVSTVEEGRYLIEKLYNLIISQAVSGVRSELNLEHLNVKVQQLTTDNDTQNQLLQHLISSHQLGIDLETLRPPPPGTSRSCSENSSSASSRSSSPTPSLRQTNRELKEKKANLSFDSLKYRRRTALPKDLLYVLENKDSTEKPTSRGYKSTLPTANLSSLSSSSSSFLSPSSRNLGTKPSDSSTRKQNVPETVSPLLSRKMLNLSSSRIDKEYFASPPGSPTAYRRTNSREENVFSRLTGGSQGAEQQTGRGIISQYDGKVNVKAPLGCAYIAAGHSRAVLSVYATDDLLFTASKDRSVKVWDLNGGVELESLGGHPNNVEVVKFSEPCKMLYSVSSAYVKVWDLRSPPSQCLKTLCSSGLTTNGPTASTTQTRTVTVPQGETHITDIALSKCGTVLYMAAGDRVRVWDLRKFSSVGKLAGGHQAAVMRLAVGKCSETDDLVVTGSKDHYIKIFEVSRESGGIFSPKVNLNPPHYDGIQSLALHGDVLFSGSRDTCIKKWDLSRQELDQSINNAHSNWICGLVVMPGGRHLISGCRGGILKVWSVDSCTLLGEVRAHSSPVNAVAVNSALVFTASNTGEVKMWRPNQSVSRMSMSTGKIYQLTLFKRHSSGNSSRSERTKRQTGAWQLLLSSPCLTSQGKLGKCTSFRACYPYFKLPNLKNWESWVFGVYDTCSYFTDNGQQAFGVCCTETGSTRPVDPPRPPPTTTKSPFVEQSTSNPIPPSWPPPLPTHPPDHTIPPLPTHPPSPGYPRPPSPSPPSPPPFTSTSTSNPNPFPPVFSTQKPTPVAPIAPPSIPTTDNEIVDASCGAKNGYQDQERIVGGQSAEVGEWPWIAALFNSGRQFCGGSLIDDEHILTAAHCVAHMSSWDVARMTVRLGDHNIRTNSETKHVEKKVKRVVRHRGFDPRTLYNDVAVLTLDSPITFTRNIRPICLPSGSQNYAGQPATVIGWGSLRESGSQPAVLQEVNIPIWTNQDCRVKYGHAAPGGIVEHFLCAGQPSRDSCSGDSGGPLMINQGKWTQVGIVSWGIGCGKGQYPGVYTRVTHFMPWINKNLK